jgi:endonuclease YncB( thermonuclease family)
MQLNAVGNRKAGRVLNLGYATSVLYPLSTRLDPFPGEYPPTDTGSSGLASAKAAKQLGIGGDYFWLFDVNAVVQAVIDGDVVSVGTVWTDGMFDLDGRGFIAPTGNIAGGHQYAIRDGDTCAAIVDRGGRDWWLVHIRCAGYDSAELTGDTKPQGARDRAAASSHVEVGEIVYLDSLAFVASHNSDSFGRMLAYVSLPDERDLAQLMVSSGNGAPRTATELLKRFYRGS